MLCHLFQWARDHLGKSSFLDLLEGHSVLPHRATDTVSVYSYRTTDYPGETLSLQRVAHGTGKMIPTSEGGCSAFYFSFSAMQMKSDLTFRATTESLDWKLQYYVLPLLVKKGNLFCIHWCLLQNTVFFEFISISTSIISMPLLTNFTAFSREVFTKMKTSGQHSIKLLFLEVELNLLEIGRFNCIPLFRVAEGDIKSISTHNTRWLKNLKALGGQFGVEY